MICEKKRRNNKLFQEISLTGSNNVLINPKKKKMSRNYGVQLARSLSKLLRDAAKLAAMISNQNISDLHNKTIRVASPRFFSILPDSDTQNMVRYYLPFFSENFIKYYFYFLYKFE